MIRVFSTLANNFIHFSLMCKRIHPEMGGGGGGVIDSTLFFLQYKKRNWSVANTHILINPYYLSVIVLYWCVGDGLAD